MALFGPWMDGNNRVNRGERRKRAVYVQSCSDEINGRNGLVQMEDSGGQGELCRKMKTITALHPTGTSGRRSGFAVLGRDSYPKPRWPLNSERWYQPLLFQTSSVIVVCIPSLAFIFFLCVKLSCSLYCMYVETCLFIFILPGEVSLRLHITGKT